MFKEAHSGNPSKSEVKAVRPLVAMAEVHCLGTFSVDGPGLAFD